MPPETTLRIGPCQIHVMGTIQGLEPEAHRVREAITQDTTCIALGIPPEDVEALQALHDEPALAEELPEPDEWTARLLELLGRWGPTSIPAADLAAAHKESITRGIPLEALDLDDDTHTEAHTDRLKLRHIVRMNRTRNKMLKASFEQEDPYDLMVAWDAQEHRSPQLRAIQQQREVHMAERIRELAGQHKSILAILPAPRYPGVVALLGQAS